MFGVLHKLKKLNFFKLTCYICQRLQCIFQSTVYWVTSDGLDSATVLSRCWYSLYESFQRRMNFVWKRRNADFSSTFSHRTFFAKCAMLSWPSKCLADRMIFLAKVAILQGSLLLGEYASTCVGHANTGRLVLVINLWWQMSFYLLTALGAWNDWQFWELKSSCLSEL